MKETYYFPHDYNARNDEKLIKLQKEVGLEAIAIYWMLIEMLYESNGYLDCIPDNLAFAMRTHSDLIPTIKKVIFDYDLFIIESSKFTSKRVLENIKFRQKKSEKARKSAENRWNNANALRTQSEGNAIKERKGKERKDINIYISEEDFNHFWSIYPRKTNKAKAKEKFLKLKKELLPVLEQALEKQKQSEQWQNEKFIPHLATWLNQKRWEDETSEQTPEQIAKYLVEKYGVDRAMFRFASSPTQTGKDYWHFTNDDILKYKHIFGL